MNFLNVFLASIVASTYCMVGCVLFQSVLTTIVRGLATASVVVTTGTSICSSSRSLFDCIFVLGFSVTNIVLRELLLTGL